MITPTDIQQRQPMHPSVFPLLSAAELDQREAACRELLDSAGRVAMAGYLALAAGGAVSMKGPQDFLTETDGEVEAHLRDALLQRFPGDGFLGEESGGALTARMWVVDPIDGTANFARGIPHFCVSVGFIDNGVIEIGGIANPATGEVYFARRGRGATCNGKPMHVAQTQAYDRASVELGWSRRISTRAYVETIAALIDLGTNVRRSASGALALAFVAQGRLDAYAEMHINPWDCLAGLLLVEEAGGRVNDFLAGHGLSDGNPVLACAPGIANGMEQATSIRLSPQRA